jgi:hypothetical protein
MKTIEESLPGDEAKLLGLVEQETGLTRDQIIGTSGVHYQASTDRVCMNPHPSRPGIWKKREKGLWQRLTGK